MTSHRKTENNELIFGVHNHFQSGIFPITIQGREYVVDAETPVDCGDDSYFLLVTAGAGTMYVNNIHFSLKRGMLICLGPFHACRIVPQPGAALHLMEAHINSGAYMYILSCPYLPIKTLIIPDEPAIVSLSEPETHIAETIIQKLPLLHSVDYLEEKLSFLYIMQLYGLLISNS